MPMFYLCVCVCGCLCLCVCVCVFRDALLLRTRPEDMVSVLHTNLLGSMLTCRAALRSMLRTPGAAIVNIGTATRGRCRSSWRLKPSRSTSTSVITKCVVKRDKKKS